MNKAQASVELLIILAVSMIAIGLIIALSNNEISSINLSKANSDARFTAEKIAKTAEEVYVSGPGTKKQIFVSIPSGIDENKTSVSNKTIRLNVNGTDIIAETKVEVTGNIPTSPGGHWIWITAFEGYVVIGSIQIETDKGSIYSTIAQETSTIEQIKVINNTAGNANVQVSFTWNETEISMQSSNSSFNVPADSNSGIDLNFTSTSNAVGNYVGEIVFEITTIDGIKQIVVPITIEVIIGGTGEQPLMIFPAEWNLLTEGGFSETQNFQVCNTTSSELTNIVFSPSIGDAGNWIQPIPAINSLAGNTCEEITIRIDVPLGASSNTGTITGSDGTNSDFISLNVSIKAMANSFNFDWNTAFFSRNERLDNWTIENTSASSEIKITRMIVWDWTENDLDSALLNRIRFNNSNYWSGTATAGEWINITDFTINPLTQFTAGNRLQFTQNVRNEGEYFRITFEFIDGSTYTTDTYYSSDIVPPIVALESPAEGYTSSTFAVDFEYNVIDVDSAIDYCELIIDGSVNQTDNSITEGTTQSFTKIFSVNGTYVWDVNCVDDSTNSNKGTSGENRLIEINSTGPTPPIIIAFDVFPDGTWNKGAGWLYDWYHLGDASLRTDGPYSSPRHLRLRRNTGYVDRAVDLSSYSNPKLEFWARVRSFEGSDQAYVMVSPDDVHWFTLRTFTSADSDNQYHFYEFDLNPYGLSNEFWIAFDAEMNSTGNYFYIDDVNIVQRTP